MICIHVLLKLLIKGSANDNDNDAGDDDDHGGVDLS